MDHLVGPRVEARCHSKHGTPSENGSTSTSRKDSRNGDAPNTSRGKIAARTVNKERARSGEAKQASSASTQDISSSRRRGLRSHRGSGGRTRDQLYEDARRKGIEGRSKMNKAQLERAVGR